MLLQVLKRPRLTVSALTRSTAFAQGILQDNAVGSMRYGACRGFSSHSGTFFFSELEVHRHPQRRHVPDLKNIKFGEVFTDHMLLIENNAETGWGPPQIKPFGSLNVHPASSGLHYGMSCFEGMKAYMGPEKGLLFRPDMNMHRFHAGTQRLCLADFDPKELLRCLKHLLRMDKAWLPHHPNHSLYIRPFAFAASQTLGVAPPTRTVMAIIMCPVGPYFPSGVKPISLYIDDRNVRAWPGGVGHLKMAGNYAPTIAPQIASASLGAQQTLYALPPGRGPHGHAEGGGWDPLDSEVSECGTMNMFFVFSKADDSLEIATPPLDGTILPGVTRDSVIQLARQLRGVTMTERPVTVRELRHAALEGRLLEAFGTGTACSIQPVTEFKRNTPSGVEALRTARPADDPETIALRLRKQLEDIQTGKVKSPWSVPFD